MSQDEYNASVPNRIQAARFLLAMLEHFRGRKIDDDSVLDIGCGPEVLLKPLWANVKNIPKYLTGIDNNSEYSSQDFWREPNRKFIQTDFLEWKPDEKFSVMWSSMSAHWITGPAADGKAKSRQFFQIISDALKDDGYFACIAPAGKNFYPLISKLAVVAFQELKYSLGCKRKYDIHRDKYCYFWDSISEIIKYGSKANLQLCGIYKTRDWQHVKTTEIGKIWKSANEILYEKGGGVDTEKVAQKIDEILIRAIDNKPEAVECTSEELGTSIFKSDKEYHYLLPYIDSFVFVFKKSKIIGDRSIANNPYIKSDLLMYTLDRIRNMEGKASLVKDIEYQPAEKKDSIENKLDNTALQVFTDIVCDRQLQGKLIYAGRSYPGEKNQIADVENSYFNISHKWRRKIIDDEEIKRRKNLFKPEIGLQEKKAESKGFFGIALCVVNRKNPVDSFRFINSPKINGKRIAYIGIASPPVPAFDHGPPEDAEEYLRIIRGIQAEDIFSVFAADDDAFRIFVSESENDPCAIKHFHYFRWQASYYQPNLFILSHTTAKPPPVSEGGGKNFAAFLSIALDKFNQANGQLTNLDITELAHCLKAISLLEDIAYQRKLSYEKLFKEDRETFRALYNLPQETIDLLKKTYIPPVSMESGDIINSTVTLTEAQTEEFAEKIISRIPKADLHVHVGSCMSPEFLVAASIISLLRLDSSDIDVIRKAIKKTYSFFKRKKGIIFKPPIGIKKSTSTITWNGNIAETSEKIMKFVKKQIDYAESIKNRTGYREFRSALHDVLSLDDHWDEQHLKAELRKRSNISLLLFALMYGQINGEKPTTNLSKEDILRIVIIVLATTYQDKDTLAKLSILGQDVLPWFNVTKDIDESTWMELHHEFYKDEGHFAIQTFRGNGWELNNCKKFQTPISIHLKKSNRDYLTVAPKDFKEDPILYLLASGTRANNLKDYLEGCELSGAEHLQHPFLMHLYAQQLLHQFKDQGIMYAELRAAATGYTTKHFSFSDVCSCMQTAFSQAQKMVNFYSPDKERNCWLWETPFAFNDNRKERDFDDTDENNGPKGTLFPIKINIVLTGKRHKPIRQIIQEAAAGVVFHHHEETPKPRPEDKHKQENYDKEAWGKYKENMNSCHFVGFDLAGQEDGYPPEAYRKEFEQLSKMHIPITVHCGENAPAKFVESAVLDLGAKRLGHGLSVAADQKLMDRIREYRVCIELCPISNFQTNHLLPHEEDEGIKKPGRQYPLRKLLENGNAICLNTDNPIISHTNMVKECFQASYAYGGKGLSLWDLLSIIRMGFYYAFLQSPERKNIIRYAEKKILNIFEEDEVLAFLYDWKKK
ncbi:MAG: methyltransferase domain-containing protein [Candidatus Brocadiaceae bacterium]|nr:methyltransferase domain-containing protein [Candidatus Brocadiaceae bacterium]